MYELGRAFEGFNTYSNFPWNLQNIDEGNLHFEQSLHWTVLSVSLLLNTFSKIDETEKDRSIKYHLNRSITQLIDKTQV